MRGQHSIQQKPKNKMSEGMTGDKEEAVQTKSSAGAVPSSSKTNTTNPTGLPSPLKGGLERISGLDLSAVRVQRNSSGPGSLNSLAWAQGRNVHLGPGKSRIYLKKAGMQFNRCADR